MEGYVVVKTLRDEREEREVRFRQMDDASPQQAEHGVSRSVAVAARSRAPQLATNSASLPRCRVLRTAEMLRDGGCVVYCGFGYSSLPPLKSRYIFSRL